jgi:hypothetical protein
VRVGKAQIIIVHKAIATRAEQMRVRLASAMAVTPFEHFLYFGVRIHFTCQLKYELIPITLSAFFIIYG